MFTENSDGEIRGHHNCSYVGNSAMVLTTITHDNGCSKDSATKVRHSSNASKEGNDTSSSQENDHDGLQSIRRSLETQGISRRASDIILQSWRKGTRKQYVSYIKRWTKYCHSKNVSWVDPSISQALDFLVELYDQGLGHSALNTARSALSCILKPVNGITFGAHPTVTRFLKGVFESRPTVSRYTETWDVGTVLRHLKTIPTTRDVPLKDLTLKTVVLMSLVSAQRGQTIHMLNLEDMTSTESQITFVMSKPIKQTKPGTKSVHVQFTSYPADPLLCVVTTLREYLARANELRGQCKQVFISYLKPFRPVSRSTISRWVKVVMKEAGINVDKFKPHSPRSTSTSKASLCSVPLDQIMSAAGWSSATTFARFYNKPIDVNNGFADSILSLK